MPTYKYSNAAGKTMWYCSFYYTDWKGERKRKVKRGFATRRDASRYEDAYKVIGSKEPTIQLGDVVEDYLKDCELKLKPTTMKNKRVLIETKILPTFGDLRLCDINVNMIRGWQNDLLSFRDPDGRGYEQTYLYSIHRELSGIFNFGVKFYGLGSNPCRLCGPIGREGAGEMKIWTQEQFEKFIRNEDRRDYRTAFDILFYGGLRKGELLGLMPADLIPERKAIRITRNFETVDGVDMLIDPKTEKSKRVVTLPGRVYEELSDLIRETMCSGHERVFSFKYPGLWAEFRRVTAVSQLPPIRIHDLRHSHASMLIDMGFNVQQIAERLGHSNANTTMRVYAHLYPDRDVELAQKLDDMIRK